MTIVYCFMGYPGSGKSTASSIAADLGLSVVVMGDVVRESAYDDLGDDATSDDIGTWASGYRDQYGNDIFARHTSSAVKSLDEDVAIIDGVRTPTELSVFRDRFETVTVVFIDTSFETRLARLQERGREGEEKFTADDLNRRDQREYEWGTGVLVENEHYDVRLTNEGTFGEFKAHVGEVLDTL